MTCRVLIVEDDAVSQELMGFLIRAFGHEVLTAGNGREGVEAARRELPALILMDVRMPVMTGLEAVLELKRDISAAIRHIPVIAVTAFAMVGDRDQMLRAGFDGYITKPINPETFLQQIQPYLGQSLAAPAPISIDEAASEAAPEPAPVEAHCDVLVIDDVPANIDLTRIILEPAGFSVRAVAT